MENRWQPEACDSQVEQLIGYALLAIFSSWKMKVRLIAINDNEKAELCNQILDKSIGHADYLVNSDIVRRRQTDKHMVFFLFIDDMVSYNRHRTHPQRVTWRNNFLFGTRLPQLRKVCTVQVNERSFPKIKPNVFTRQRGASEGKMCPALLGRFLRLCTKTQGNLNIINSSWHVFDNDCEASLKSL